MQSSAVLETCGHLLDDMIVGNAMRSSAVLQTHRDMRTLCKSISCQNGKVKPHIEFLAVEHEETQCVHTYRMAWENRDSPTCKNEH